jgi:Contractile injection system tube protein/LysM domain
MTDKLTIAYEVAKNSFTGPSDSIRALFNPNKLARSKAVTWQPEKPARTTKVGEHRNAVFRSVELETLSVSLFFDTYEAGAAPSGGGLLNTLGLVRSSGSSNTGNVLSYTQRVAALAQFNEKLGRPPVCALSWGRTPLFKGVLTTLSQSFTLFLENGTPVRATLDCVFQEFRAEIDAHAAPANAGASRRYVVRPGDTLSSIALDVYDDQTAWRKIAAANRIANPRLLTPGRVLTIPPLG